MTTETALTVVERASVALGSSALEIHLTDLVKKHADIVTIANKDGREQVHAAAMVLRKQRTTIAAAGKGARDDATKFCKAVIDEEKRLIAIIEPEECRFIKMRDEWDEAREAEKVAAAEAEAKRKAWHESQVAGIRGVVLSAAGAPSQKLRDLIHEVDLIEPSEELHAEYMPVVARAKAETLDKLRAMLAEAESREADQARIKAEQEAAAAQLAAERAEMERQLAEAQEQARIAAEKAEAERKEAAAKLEAERAEIEKVLADQRAQAAAERKRMEDEQAAFRAQQAEFNRQKEELQRIEDERAAEAKRQQDAIDRAKAEAAKAEADRIAAEKAEADRAERARIQAAAEAAKQAEELAERLKREANAPQAGEIVTLIADHYRISNGAALDWLRVMFGDVRQAA